MRIKPFEALRPEPDTAESVASVPYDTLNTEEARIMADGNPKSFLRIVRPEINLSTDSESYSEEIFSAAKEAFKEFQDNGTLVRESKPCFYIYKMKAGDHVQHGLLTCCHVDDYQNNIIKRHEKTRKDKENERTKHIQTLNANTGPILLTYKDSKAVDEIVATVEKEEPLFDFTSPDGIINTVWRISDTEKVIEAFNEIPSSYIADGHHRGAAALNAAIMARSKDSAADEEFNWFMTILFPASQLKILAYNRCVHDLNGLDEDSFLARVKESFDVSETSEPEPEASGSVCMYLNEKWYKLKLPPASTDDPVAALDVSILQDQLLSPILGIKDPRTDKRIDFIGGSRGTKELIKLVDSGKGAVAFSMHPVRVEQMMDVADANRIMPPKSTWFEPKPKSGLLVHTF